MSTNCGEEIFGIGQRLREERDRIGLSQVVFGAKLDTTDRTVKKWEGNETSPRATDLLAAAGLGVDVLYVVTGQRAPLAIRQETGGYTAAQRLAEFIAPLTLSEEDADMLRGLAQRLSI